MILQIAKWLLLLIAFKVIVALVVAQCYTDPRRDITARKQHLSAFNPNVVFIGTSRTLYGIDPALFDSLNHQKTRSYNFGIFSLSPYSAIQLASDMLTENPRVTTIYIELSALEYSTVALQPQEVIPDAVFRAQVMADAPAIGTSKKVGSFLSGLNTTLFQMVSIAPQILSAKKAIKPENDPVEGNADLHADGHQSVAGALPATNERITANKTSTKAMRAIHKPAAPNAFYLAQLNSLAALARQQGKQVIFYYPNSITAAEQRVLAQVAPFLPDAQCIPLPAPPMFDSLFMPGNLFDAHHLNQWGASAYTRFFREEAAKRISVNR